MGACCGAGLGAFLGKAVALEAGLEDKALGSDLGAGFCLLLELPASRMRLFLPIFEGEEGGWGDWEIGVGAGLWSIVYGEG